MGSASAAVRKTNAGFVLALLRLVLGDWTELGNDEEFEEC
jgi:hypothetical protein